MPRLDHIGQMSKGAYTFVKNNIIQIIFAGKSTQYFFCYRRPVCPLKDMRIFFSFKHFMILIGSTCKYIACTHTIYQKTVLQVFRKVVYSIIIKADRWLINYILEEIKAIYYTSENRNSNNIYKTWTIWYLIRRF